VSVAPTARAERHLAIGRSSMSWEGDRLVIDIDERTSPLPRALRGRVTLHPTAESAEPHLLDREGHHAWWPTAPMGALEVELTEPRLRFRGHGYHDANAGSQPLEASFSRWGWQRARLDERTACMTYDLVERSGERRSLALGFDRDGVGAPSPRRSAHLPRTRWRIDREVVTESTLEPRARRTLEDTPFYARTLVDTHLAGQPVVAVHETLSLDRLDQRWVQSLLGFRMGRA
jgi:carotenoid 1,2-hydratase